MDSVASKYGVALAPVVGCQHGAASLHRVFNHSWPQCLLLLVIAGIVVAVPAPFQLRFVLAALLVAVVAVGVFVKVTCSGSRRSGFFERSGDVSQKRVSLDVPRTRQARQRRICVTGHSGVDIWRLLWRESVELDCAGPRAHYRPARRGIRLE